MGFEPFWYHFWRLGIFYVFEWKIMFLMWEKNRHQSFVFLVTIFSLQITTILSALNFPNFKLKLIITFDIIAADNFYDNIWNQHILIVNILQCEGNQRGKKSPPTQPHNKTFLGFKKGGYCMVKWKFESSFLEQIIFMDPLGVCSASSLRGIRHLEFYKSKNAYYLSCHFGHFRVIKRVAVQN